MLRKCLCRILLLVQNNELEIEEQLKHLLSDVDALKHDLGGPPAPKLPYKKPDGNGTEPEKPKPTEPELPPETKRPTEEPVISLPSSPEPPRPTEEPEKEKPKMIPVEFLMKSMKAKVGDLYFNMFTVMGSSTLTLSSLRSISDLNSLLLTNDI